METDQSPNIADRRIWSRAIREESGSRAAALQILGWNRARADAEGGDLAAAAGDVGKACGAEAGEETAEFSAEEVGGEIDEHVAVVNFADISDVGKNFAADG